MTGPFPDAGDAAACGCQMNGYLLTMSWDCFCKAHDCTKPMIAGCPMYGEWTRGCGLTQYSLEGGFSGGRQAYDQSGQLVGVQWDNDYPSYPCPTDPSMVGTSVRAGQLLETCDSVSTCACRADSGVCDPTDAGF